MQPKELTLPLDQAALEGLEAGDEVLLYGPAITLRDAALARMEEALGAGREPPFSLEGETVLHAGPSPPTGGRPAGVIGPTTSGRMDRYLDMLFGLGVKATLGKGPRGGGYAGLHREHGAVYLVSVGGTAALLGGRVRSIEKLAWEDLGPEAVHRVELDGFPAFVAIDTTGRDFLGERRRKYRSSRDEGD